MTDDELTEKVARAICIANADEDTPDSDEIWAKGFPAEGPAWTHFIREATAAIAAVREADELDAAVRAAREACAKVASDFVHDLYNRDMPVCSYHWRDIRDAILAGGE